MGRGRCNSGVIIMPPKSEKQRRLMQAVKHDPSVAKKTGISPSAARKVLGEGESRNKPYKASGAASGKYKKF